MVIIAHRGCWQRANERNTLDAFGRAFEAGFGVETDIRDRCGSLVISHDMPDDGCPTLEELLDLYRSVGQDLRLALNIKADGLHTVIKREVERFGVSDFFVFDMSVPDTLGYLGSGMPVYTRRSEYEESAAFYEKATGIWIDCFEHDVQELSEVQAMIRDGKRVCFVSPELHGRPHEAFWSRLAKEIGPLGDDVALCTDHPHQARRFFDGED